MARDRAQTAFDIALQRVLEEGESPPPMIIHSARKPGSKEVIKHSTTKVESIRDTIIRIQQDADPIGFLVAVQQGALIEVVGISQNAEGEPVQTTHYVQASIKQRIDTARFLAGKVLPSMSVQKVVVEDQRPADGEEQHYRPGEQGQPTFAQLVHKAAANAMEITQAPQKPKVIITEPRSTADGRPVYEGSAGEGLGDDEDLTYIPE